MLKEIYEIVRYRGHVVGNLLIIVSFQMALRRAVVVLLFSVFMMLVLPSFEVNPNEDNTPGKKMKEYHLVDFK